MEVHTTYEIVCNGIAYIDDTEYNSPNDVLCYVNNIKKERLRISKKMYNINSNSYKNITANKSVEVVNLYNDFEKYILGKDKKLIRNFLVKGIVFKQKIRVAEVVLKSRELTIVFLRDVKEYDTDNLLTVQKGRENQRLSLAMTVSNADELEYAKRIFDKEYELINDKTEEKRVNELYTILYSKIKGINKSVSAMKINKGTIFKGKRNFCILEKRKYGYNIRLLPVVDTDNILGVVGRSKYEPLCRYFKVKDISDIDIIMPYLERAYEMTKYPAIDIKNGIVDNCVK